MGNKVLSINLVKVRMLLENICDGFDTACSNKKSLLTTKIKVLFLLNEQEKISPSIIINKVGVAKSNLAILANGMIAEGLIEKLADTFDKRVIYYKITKKGKELLDKELENIGGLVCDCGVGGDVCNRLNKPLQEIINILG